MTVTIPEVDLRAPRQVEVGTPERSKSADPPVTNRGNGTLPRQLLRRLPIILAVGVLVSLGFSFLAVDRSVFRRIADGSSRYFALAILLALVPWLTNSLRLMIWTRFLGRPLGLVDAWRIVLGTDVAAAATPTAIGGGPLKIALLVQRKFKPGEAVMLTSLSSLEDALFFTLAVPFAILWTSRNGLPNLEQPLAILDRLLVPLVVVIACLGMGWTAWRIVRRRNRTTARRAEGTSRLARGGKRIREALHQAKEAYILIGRRGKGRLILSMGLSMIQWSTRFLIAGAIAAGFGVMIDPVRCFVTQWLVYTLLAAVPSPGATGGAEAGFYLIFGTCMPAEVLGIVTVAWRFVSFHMLVGLAAILFALLEHASMRRGEPSVVSLLEG